MRNSGGPAITTETLTPQAQYRKKMELYDGFLRLRQTQVQATGGGRTVTETLNNSLGQIDWTSGAYYDSTNTAVGTTLASPQGQIPAVTKYVYDGAGRTTASIFKANGTEKWRTSTSYGGDRTHVTPPTGGTAQTTVTDARGNTVELRQYKTFSDVGSSDPAKYDRTIHAYTVLGQLQTVTDPSGNSWSYTYDLRGRQKTATDPDKGTATSTYDAAGNLQTVTAPLGSTTATTAFTYDAIGRRTSIRDNSTTGAKRAEWVYDTLPNGLGRLTSATRYSSGNTYISKVDSYDSYGRPTSTSVVLPAAESDLCAAASPNTCTYTTTMTYRPNGQPSTVTMPAAADLVSEKLTFGYTDVGNPGTIYSASQMYVYSISYNKLDQLIGRQLGAYGYRVAQAYTYDEPTRRLNNANVVPELKPEAANHSYTYDNAGNITKISDAPQGQTADRQCFEYDYLRRLTHAWTQADGNCATARSVAGLGGPAPYWHSWTFDAIGNRKTETRHATTSTTYSYTYPGSGDGSVLPHAVMAVTAAGAESWTRNYGYDNAGNTISRQAPNGASQTLSWDQEGKLTSLKQGSATTNFIYDADGNRLIRKDPDGSKTLYLGGTEVRNVGTVKTASRYYSHAGTTIGTRTAAGLHWVIGDHHGTAELAIKASDLAVAKRRSLPYGAQRGSIAGTWPAKMEKGFVGGTIDPTGTVHLGARQYDTALGRFLSVDPIVNFNDSQQMNGYAYANNTPVTLSDPSGTIPEGMSSEEYKARIVASQTNNVAVPSPTVTNGTLQRTLNDIYGKPGTKGVIGQGKTGDAIQHELRTGLPTVRGGIVKMHYEEGARQFKELSDLLEANRKAVAGGKPPVLTPDEERIARREAKELWNALNAEDRTGRVAKYYAGTPAAGDSKNAITKASRLSAVADITKATFDDPKMYNGKEVKGPRQASGPVTRGFARTILLVDLASVGLMVAVYGPEATWDSFVTGIVQPIYGENCFASEGKLYCDYGPMG